MPIPVGRGGAVRLLVPIALAAACSGGGSHATARATSVRAEVGFTCLWWSAEQMEGMDPNSPPPKTTEVPLTAWEYTDPVAVPHPDVVTVVVTIRNDGAGPALVDAEATAQWGVGPQASAAQSQWREPAALDAWHDIELAPGAATSRRVAVDLKKVMDALGKEGHWPHALRVLVAIKQAGAAGSPFHARAELPIRPGD